MPNTPPTLVSQASTAYNTLTDPKTLSVAALNGDLIVVTAMMEDGAGTFAAITASGLTFTQRQMVDTASNVVAAIWTAPVTSSTTFNLSLDETTNTGKKFGFTAYVWRDHDGPGTTSNGSGTGAPSLTSTVSQDNSAYVFASGDWNASDGTSRTWRTANVAATETVYGRDSATYTWYAGYYSDTGTSQSRQYGLSAPTGQKFIAVGIEVKGLASSSTTLSPTGFGGAEAFGSPTLVVPTNMQPTGINDPATFGSPTLTNLNTLTPTGISTGATFGTPTLTNLNTLTPGGIATGAAFGTPTLVVPTNMQPTGISDPATFGTPTLSSTISLTPTGIPSAATFGTPLLAVGAGLVPPGIASGESFGAPTLVVPTTLAPTGIASAQAFGTPQVTWPITLSPSGIATAATFGTPAAAANVTLSPTGINDVTTFGTPTLVVPINAQPTSISTGAAFGTPTVINMSFVGPTSITTGEAFGTPTVQVNALLAPTGIATGAAFGTPALNNNVKVMQPAGIAGLGTFGTPTITADSWRQIIERAWWKEAVNSHQRTVGHYAEMINEDGEHVITIPVSGGSIDYDGEAAEQWGCNVTVVGTQWVPRSPKDPLDPRSAMRCRLWWRLDYKGGWVAIPVGTYILEDPQVHDDGTTPVTNVKGSDPLALIRRNGYGNNVIQVGGLTIPAALTRILQVVAAGQPIQIESTSTVTLPAIYELTGGDPLDDLTNIAAQAGLVIRTDRMGTIICAPEPDTEIIRADWQEGEDCPIIDMDRDISSSNMVNSVTVVTTSPEVNPPIAVTVEDTDPSSPTYVGGKWGRRSITIRTDSVATEDGATALATATLNGRRRPMETITVEVPQRGDLGFRDPIKLHRAASYVADTYRISKWTLPLGGAADAPPTMQVTMMSRSST